MTTEQFLEHFQPHPVGAGFMARIPFNDETFEASIVAGAFFYSTPRIDFDKPSQYSAFEVAIFNKSTSDWATYNELKSSGVFDAIGYGEHEYTEDERKDEGLCNVFGYVPVEQLLSMLSK